jgi:hypothetical protein
MTPQERLDYLLESVFVPTNKQVLVADLVDAVGDNGSRLVLGTLQAAAAQDPLLAAAYQALATVGISLSPLDRQAMVDQLATAGSWPDATRDAVKALGGVYRKRWQIEGYDSEPTLEVVQEIIAAEAIREAARQKLIEIQARRQRWDAVSAIIRSRIETDAVSSIESILEAVESEWGSN